MRIGFAPPIEDDNSENGEGGEGRGGEAGGETQETKDDLDLFELAVKRREKKPPVDPERRQSWYSESSQGSRKKAKFSQLFNFEEDFKLVLEKEDEKKALEMHPVQRIVPPSPPPHYWLNLFPLCLQPLVLPFSEFTRRVNLLRSKRNAATFPPQKS